MKYSIVLALLASALAGCSGKAGGAAQGSASSSAQTAAPVTASSASAAATSGTTGVAASGAAPNAPLPVYPGATKLATQATKPMTFCHHRLTIVVYRVSADPDTVAHWYEGRMPGATSAKIATQTGEDGEGTTGYFIVASGGASAAIVDRVHFGKLEKSAQQFGMAYTTIGLNAYDPPMAPEEVQMIKDASTASASDKAQMAAALKQKCGAAL